MKAIKRKKMYLKQTNKMYYANFNIRSRKKKKNRMLTVVATATGQQQPFS